MAVAQESTFFVEKAAFMLQLGSLLSLTPEEDQEAALLVKALSDIVSSIPAKWGVGCTGEAAAEGRAVALRSASPPESILPSPLACRSRSTRSSPTCWMETCQPSLGPSWDG